MANTIRRPRDCEVCGESYRPTYYEQRTCGRTCGVVITRRPAERVRRSTRVPDDHPARWVGNATPVHYSDCAWCGNLTASRRLDRAYCSDDCDRRAKRNRRKSRECGTPEWQTWTHSQFMSMARNFDYCCAYCGVKPDRLDPDHVVPLSRGGSNTLSNLLPTCLSCNSDKRDLPLNEWNQDRDRRGLPPRTTAWSPGDSRYTHLSVQSESAAA